MKIRSFFAGLIMAMAALVGCEQVEQLGTLHARQVAEHGGLVELEVGRQLGDVHLVGDVVGKVEHHGLQLAGICGVYTAELRHLLVDDEADDILYAAVVLYLLAIVEGVVAHAQILLEEGLGMAYTAHLVADAIGIGEQRLQRMGGQMDVLIEMQILAEREPGHGVAEHAARDVGIGIEYLYER